MDELKAKIGELNAEIRAWKFAIACATGQRDTRLLAVALDDCERECSAVKARLFQYEQPALYARNCAEKRAIVARKIALFMQEME